MSGRPRQWVTPTTWAHHRGELGVPSSASRRRSSLTTSAAKSWSPRRAPFVVVYVHPRNLRWSLRPSRHEVHVEVGLSMPDAQRVDMLCSQGLKCPRPPREGHTERRGFLAAEACEA